MTAPTVSLVLGSGGARGYAHIGAIEELLAQGYDIRCVAGSSMGALVGGVYATGKLDDYRDWAVGLQRLDVLRLLDWTWRGGLIKGDRIIARLKELIGTANIEDLSISYTAVAVDLMAQREVWFSRGPLFDAIRASIAIPAVLRPHHYKGRLLVDGGLLNPVPITPTLRDLTDCTIAVDLNAPAALGDGNGIIAAPADAPPVDAAEPSATTDDAELDVDVLPADATPEQAQSYRQKIAGFFGSRREPNENKPIVEPDPGILELFARSLDVVQETITRFKLAAQPPDLVVPIPRNACAFYEFHRAAELIEIGRLRTREALRTFKPPHKH